MENSLVFPYFLHRSYNELRDMFPVSAEAFRIEMFDSMYWSEEATIKESLSIKTGIF